MTNGRCKKKDMKKKNYLKKGVALALMLFTMQSSFAGGPWLFKKNEGFIQTSVVLPAYAYSSLLMGTLRETQEVNRKTHNSDYSIYLEYGITDKLNVISTLPFKYVKTDDLTDGFSPTNLLEDGDLGGISNYKLALKYGIIDAKVKVALSLQTSWNTIKQDLDKGLSTGYDANSYGLMLHIGRSKEKQYGFLEVGYNLFSNNYSDAIELKIEHGWKLSDHFYLAGSLDGRFSMHNGSYNNENLKQTGLSPNDQEWAYFGVKVAYEKDNGFGINANMPLVPITFKYVGFNGAIGFGAYKKF